MLYYCLIHSICEIYVEKKADYGIIFKLYNTDSILYLKKILNRGKKQCKCPTIDLKSNKFKCNKNIYELECFLHHSTVEIKWIHLFYIVVYRQLYTCN